MNCIAFIFRITIQSVKVVAAILRDYVISPGKHRVSVGSTVCWTRLWSPVCSGWYSHLSNSLDQLFRQAVSL